MYKILVINVLFSVMNVRKAGCPRPPGVCHHTEQPCHSYFTGCSGGNTFGYNIKNMKPTLFLLTLLLLATGAFAQGDTVENALLRDVPVWMAQNHVPCAGVGIIEDGKIKWIKIFGELQKGHPAPENTLFNIASQTKPVTALLTLKLVQLGLWNLDEPLAHYWIDPDIAADPYLQKLTTRLVLSHQTGFPNWRTDNGSTKLHFKFEPGTKFGYSGEGFEYLRRSLEKKFHEPMNILLDSFLLKPLGITQTQYWSDHLDTTRFAQWHDGQGNRYNVSIQTPVNAADDLITTVEDYCKLIVYTMNGAGLSDSLFADMTRPQVTTKENSYMGLGWGLIKGLPNDEYALEHGGSDIGVRTMAAFLPKSKSGVVVMTNGDNGMFVTDQVIKRALPYGTEILETMNKSATAHVRIVLPDSIIQSYCGLYEQSNGKLLKVEQEGNAIKVSGDGAPTAVLFPESNNKFFLDGYDVQLVFPDNQSLIIFEGGRQVMKINRKAGQDSAPSTDNLKTDMNAIASDATEGRFTGSPGYRKAAGYMADQLKGAGLQTDLQPVPFLWDDYTGSTLSINGVVYPHAPGTFIILQPGKTSQGKWTVVSPGDSIPAHAAGVVSLPDQTKDWETTVIRQYRFGYMHYVPDGMPSPTGVPTIMVSPELARHLKPGDRISVVLVHKTQPRTGYNVIAVVPGTDRNLKTQTVLVGAHLDHIGRIGTHIYNGANDDASGCVAGLEAAKTLAAHPCKRTVMFAFFCGEELNLKGSRWFADHRPLSAGNIVLDIQLEQLGSLHRSVPGVWALGDTAFQSAFFSAGGMFPTADLRFTPTDSVVEELSNTDAYSFMQKKIPSLLLGSGGFDEHHTTRDNVDLIDFPHLHKATLLLGNLVSALGDSQ